MATDPFAAALVAIFASPMATWADYTPAGRATVRIRAIRDQGSQEAALGQGSVILDSNSIQIKRSDAPMPPADGDAITILRLDGAGGIVAQDHFILQGDGELDVEGVTYRCGMVTIDPPALEGLIHAYTGLVGNLSANALLVGSVAAQSLLTGGLYALAALSGQVAAQSVLTGNLNGLARMGGIVGALSQMTGAAIAYVFLVDPDGARFTDSDGAYLMELV